MSQYYFDLFDGRLVKDETGQELADSSQLCLEIRRTLADFIMQAHGPVSAVLNVRNRNNQTVATASISVSCDRLDTRH